MCIKSVMCLYNFHNSFVKAKKTYSTKCDEFIHMHIHLVME